jgi:hypothetical protein
MARTDEECNVSDTDDGVPSLIDESSDDDHPDDVPYICCTNYICGNHLAKAVKIMLAAGKTTSLQERSPGSPPDQ